MAYIGTSPTKVVSRQSANIFTYTATANQTAFTGSDANGNTLACTPSDIMVHMNGLRLEKSDYVATTTTVTLGSGAAAGDEVTITAFVTFETADAYTKSASDTRYVNTSGDTMTGNLLLSSGSIGVGTTSPSQKLEVSDTTNQNVVVRVTNNDGNAEMQKYQDDLYLNLNDTGNIIVRSGSPIAEAMRIDSSGNVGIGTAAPVRNFHLHEAASSTPVVFAMSTNGTGATTGDGFNISIDGSSGAVNFIQRENESMQFYTNGGSNERMRIDGSGNLLFGNITSLPSASVFGIAWVNYANVGHSYQLSSTNGTGALSHIVFNNTNGYCGQIYTSGSVTNYVTSSDYRLKENVTDISDGITRVKQLSPKRFNFIADADTTVDGFLAHEAATVVPEAVSGTKDEVDGDGNAVMQGIDQAKIVPLITAALKEAIAKIEILETKVAALEGG